MALVIADRVRETSTTVGTGTMTLTGAVLGFQTFAVIGNANTTFYCIANQGTSEWEVGVGTYTASGTTLSRDTVLSNSAGTTAKIVFSAGTKDVFVTYPSAQAVYEDTGNAITPGTSGAIYLNSNTVTANTTIPSGYNGFSAGPMVIANGVTVTVATGSNWVTV